MVKVLIYTGCFLAVVGMLYAGYYYVASTNYDRGVTETDAKWLKVQAEAQEDKINSIRQYRDALRIQGKQLNKAVAKLGEQEEQEAINVERGKDILLDAIYSGRIKLHLPTTQARSNGGPVGGGSETESDTNESQARCPGEARGELPVAATAFLYGESGRANKLVGDYNYLVDYTNLIRSECGEN